MTAAELIALLQTKPQHLQVIYAMYSEYCLMEPKDVVVTAQCEPRPDGWVANRRPDKPTQDYLTLPGN